jgi:hypothetical protein
MSQKMIKTRLVGDGKPITFTGTAEEYFEAEASGDGDANQKLTLVKVVHEVTYEMTIDSKSKMTGVAKITGLTAASQTDFEQFAQKTSVPMEKLKDKFRSPGEVKIAGALTNWAEPEGDETVEDTMGELVWTEKAGSLSWEVSAFIGIRSNGKLCVRGSYVSNASIQSGIGDPPQIKTEGPEMSKLPDITVVAG